MAHLHLGLLAYWLVNTIRYQLKQKGINNGWQEVVYIGNIQKNSNNIRHKSRRCSEPNEKIQTIYKALNYKYFPFVKRKSVVHSSELKKNKIPILRNLWSD